MYVISKILLRNVVIIIKTIGIQMKCRRMGRLVFNKLEIYAYYEPMIIIKSLISFRKN